MTMLKTLVLPMLRMAVPNTIRHVAQMAAGALVAQGIVGLDQQATIVGVLISIASGLWSLAEKRGLLEKALA